jgi:transposase
MSRRRTYPSDLTDAQWAIIEALLPPPCGGGRPEKHPRRVIVDAILYVVRTGCSWRQLPSDFPPWQTVYWYFVAWERARVTQAMLAAVRGELRARDGRAVEPTAGIIDSQSVRGADTVGRATRGYDAGKKVNGRKRFIVTDTMGLLVVVVVLAASVQDRDGAKTTLIRSHHAAPRARFIFADAAFAGRLIDWAAQIVRMTIAVVRKPADQKGFAVIPRRWAVERTLAWITAHRRLARDYERDPNHSEAMIRWAAINTMTRRLARGHPATRPGPRPLTTAP